MYIAEGNNRYNVDRQEYLLSPGSESTACNESMSVNVGDPSSSARKQYWLTSLKSEKAEMTAGKSEGHSTGEAG